MVAVVAALKMKALKKKINHGDTETRRKRAQDVLFRGKKETITEKTHVIVKAFNMIENQLIINNLIYNFTFFMKNAS